MTQYHKSLIGSVAFSLTVLPLLLGQGCPNGVGLGLPDGSDSGYLSITPTEAQALIQSHLDDPNFIILDVRGGDEFAAGHIEGALSLCVLCSDPAFRAGLADFDRSSTILVYCRTGRRSANASSIMASEGFTNVYNMTGGIVEWQNLGLPVVK
ncbi:MAG: rhodanese-like domain-containing protein [Phycisphaerae bacterium]|nr:rhodanese-like domain-containing protein [Phycisphaerae bacterium]